MAAQVEKKKKKKKIGSHMRSGYDRKITRKPCYHKENRVMSLQISIRIEFYNKSILERLCTLDTATLSMRTHLAQKSAQNTLNHV